jgi:glutamate dehydrogenase (NADP+)
VPWIDDKGRTRSNRGWRVQWSSALGPYKGGIRFHPTVDSGVIKFLGFEQTFKNALTGMSLGSGKGGSDFNPKGKSEAEIMRFCQSFMTALAPHIGPNRDVPAGDIGVGGKEIGYMYGQYKRLKQGEFEGVLTGKNPTWGGSLIRPEATGYGCVYFARAALVASGIDMLGKRALISGSGNVAQFTAKKLIALGAIPLTFSDSAGTVYEPDGFDEEKLERLVHIKAQRGARVEEYAKQSPSATYLPGERPWSIQAELAFPSATQNEISDEDGAALVANGCLGVFEGANMPSTPEAVGRFEDAGVIFGPAKASNAGGVAVSGLEMAQNSQRVNWTAERVDKELQQIMENIHDQCHAAATEYGFDGDLKAGANIAGFKRVADALRDQGAV